MMTDRAAVASGVSMSVCVCVLLLLFECPTVTPVLLHFSLLLHLLVTNAVGLQCTELEPWLAEANVARLHRNASPTATYRGGRGTLVNTYG